MCAIWLYLIKNSNVNIKKLFNNFNNLNGRGPDNLTFNNYNNKFIVGFHRLSIMDTSINGNQPFIHYVNSKEYYICICNGEIYNANKLKNNLHYKFLSNSDCEVLIPLYLKYKEKMLDYLDGVFSFSIIHVVNDSYNVFVARDRIGVRPLFIGYKNDDICFSSEIKGLDKLFDRIEVFTPGTYLICSDKNIKKHTYYDFNYNYDLTNNNEQTIFSNINRLLTESVEKRLISDRPVCALLSGGLDSSLVCSIASRILKKYGKKLYTFSIGMEGATDIKYANMVADYIGSIHTVVSLSNREAISAIEDVIYTTETFDITTIRASVGQYLISKYIGNNSDFKVVLSGDGSDELISGYLYNFNAPSDEALHEEAERRLKEIHLYDSLRADRATSCHGLELRVPFLDHKFIDYFMSINPKLRHPKFKGSEKYLLRKSFENYLPEEVLWRQKEAFSDGISSLEDSWFATIQNYVKDKYSKEDFLKISSKYNHCCPKTNESLYFRTIFDKLFDDKYSNVIPSMWMPMWTDTDDPSARTIKDIYTK